MIPLVLFPCWFIRSVQHLLEKHPWQLLSIDFTLSLGRVFERFRRSGDLSMSSVLWRYILITSSCQFQREEMVEWDHERPARIA
ncbi:uncharacterized protein [Physcomitrium patens]|uniref:uncharacterized protein isoform X2 n=1 Tax=Physcomitrium patens TaxID=3218 RepID=UPI003CCE32C6